MPHRFESFHFAALSALVVTAAAAAQSGPLVPPSFSLDEAAQRAIQADWLTDEERADLRVFHGVWDERDLDDPVNRARVALNAWRFDAPALLDPAVPAELRAEARLGSGDLEDALHLVDGTPTMRAALLRATALERLGRYDDARRAIEPIAGALLRNTLDEADDLTDGVRGLVIRARIEGQPARDYRAMMTLLSRAHQQLDRLYWPALLTEARLLVDKGNAPEAIQALHETLALNPRCAEAWFELGHIALDRFDFDGAARAEAALRRVDAAHPLADLLAAESRLLNNDPDGAALAVERVLARWPEQREAQAMAAAVAGMRYDDDALRAALARYDELSPGGAEAYFAAGRFLSLFRQYDAAAAMLETAIERQPGWTQPRIELGLMEMQTGRDAKARAVLRETTELDPFNVRAANCLQLLTDLAEYATLETEHFIIRYLPGIDEVLVELMPERLERMHEIVSTRFGWEPSRKTIIEVMPDHQRFSVRITGMPHIHTIAACTGPIIALEVPREGPRTKHLGTFDWERVVRHEYTHTVTLEQTRFRIPHWLTEAAAVSMELAPRDYDTCRMLADSWRDGTLFDLDEIKWAFVRPKKQGDRGKAYAQGHWMVEYMNERFGSSALVTLLRRYFEGDREQDAIPAALGVSREAFYEGFLAWAGKQVRAWGLDPEPSLVELTDELREADPDMALMMAASRQARLNAIVRAMEAQVGMPKAPGDEPLEASDWPDLVRPPVKIEAAQLAEWRREYPDQPQLIAESLLRRLEGGGTPDPTMVPDFQRLIELRPVDLFPHRRLAQLYLDSDDPSRAIPHLEELDAREEKTPVYARELATLYRAEGDHERALTSIERAVSINPYRAELRELAAAIAIESRRLDRARVHIAALTLIEPDRPRHQRRLEKVDELLAATP